MEINNYLSKLIPFTLKALDTKLRSLPNPPPPIPNEREMMAYEPIYLLINKKPWFPDTNLISREQLIDEPTTVGTRFG